MLFSILVALMVILVTAFWAYQGFFSAVIMFLCSVTACTVAFGFFEQLHGAWSSKLDAGIGLPLALMLIFLASLFILRLATEKLIPANVKLPLYADRAGGGVCGLFIGLILVGMALIGIQMLPLGPSVFGFQRLTQGPDGTVEEHGFMFGPDKFTASMVGMLSDGRMGGETSFRRANPDFLMSIYGGNSNPQAEERTVIPDDALTVKAYWYTRQIDNVKQKVEDDKLEREFETSEATIGKFLVCRVLVDSKAAKTGGDMAIRFRLPQFRIIGPPPSADGTGDTPAVFVACGMSDIYTHKDHGLKTVGSSQARRLVRFGPQTDFILGPESSKVLAEKRGKGAQDFVTGYQFDVAFEVPDSFEPWYIEFKRGARAEVTKKMLKEEAPAYASVAGGGGGEADDEKPAKDDEKKDKPKKPKVGKPTGGNVSVAHAVEERTGVFARLPVPLSKEQNVVTQGLQGGKLGECHFWVELPKTPPTEDVVTEFFVPEGKKMVQVGAEKNDAYSLFGKALNYASNVAAQIKITSADGKEYFARGVYSGVEVNGKMLLEIQYFPESEDEAQRLKQAKRISPQMLRTAPEDKRMFGYVFVVDPGVKIVGFSSGGMGGKQKLDIEVPE